MKKLMKSALVALCAGLRLLLAQAVPGAGAVQAAEMPASVKVTSAKQRWPWNGKVDVGYALSYTAADEYYRLIIAVTAGDETKHVTNEVGTVTSGTITVDCDALFGAGVLAPASITMAVMACSTPAVTQKWQLTGPFLILDLGGEDGKGNFTVASYETAAELPTGAWNLETGWAAAYKTRYLVMRKVKAGKAYPCSPGAGSYPISGTMTPQKDYWIGVHQVTQEQYARVMGRSLPTSGQAKPASVSWNEIRTGSQSTTCSPTEAVASGSFMYRLYQQTGLSGFDLPTETQWEIAARAGSKAEYGSYVDDSGTARTTGENSLTNIAWHTVSNVSPYPSGRKEVGRLRPNLWGLYDTSGNVHEWCRDSMSGTAPDVETPASGESDHRVLCGGYYNDEARFCRPSYCRYYAADIDDGNMGFRLLRICEPDAQTK